MLEALRRWKGILDDAERAYDRLKNRGEPAPWLVILPVAYKRAIDRNERAPFADARLVAFAGQYLSTRYPELSEYFVSRQHRDAVESIRKTLDEFFDEKNKETDDKEAKDKEGNGIKEGIDANGGNT